MRGLRARADGRERLGVGIAGSLLAHSVILGVVLTGTQARRGTPVLPVYRVELIAARRPAVAVNGVERTTPAATTAQPPPVPTRPSPRPAQPARAAPPAATAGTGGVGVDPATIRTEGVEFPFPGYLRNLVAQVYRRWQPPRGNADLETEVFFFVNRDGSVAGLRIVRRSGSYAFDLEAQGAVEAAARSGAFGALPAGYAADVLPVSFFFTPRGIR